MTYTVKLENFEGPLDLLLYLVRKNELDIQEIPIVPVTQQYMEYLEMMQALNLDIAGEFLVMAATLLYLKSRALLPKTDDDNQAEEEQTLEALKKQLLEYQQYKDAAQRLKEQSILDKDVFARSSSPDQILLPADDTLHEANLFDLLHAFRTLLDKAENKGNVIEVTAEEISVKDKILEVLSLLQGKNNGLEFISLFKDNATRLEIITTFLALLELIRRQAVKVYQNRSFSRIYVYPVDVSVEKEERNNNNDI